MFATLGLHRVLNRDDFSLLHRNEALFVTACQARHWYADQEHTKGVAIGGIVLIFRQRRELALLGRELTAKRAAIEVGLSGYWNFSRYNGIGTLCTCWQWQQRRHC